MKILSFFLIKDVILFLFIKGTNSNIFKIVIFQVKNRRDRNKTKLKENFYYKSWRKNWLQSFKNWGGWKRTKLKKWFIIIHYLQDYYSYSIRFL